MNIYAPRRGGPQDPDATARRQAIVDVVQAVAIRSQQELADHLRRRGFQATQATLSRDLRNLGIGKVPGSEGGARYILPKTPHEVMDESQRRLEVGAFIQSVELIGNLALVRTPPERSSFSLNGSVELPLAMPVIVAGSARKASANARLPVPQPTSSTRSPGRIARSETRRLPASNWRVALMRS
jgi:arginine repressor